ncbi:MAG: YraN family protein [Deltaproteobacteria bacterium]|nr:YraN family protein [Deltaproteobacteria bacterium]MBI2342263.1 YraN family protein [Deltaproteobacteria bacterium]
MNLSRLNKGRKGEEEVEKYLIKQGFNVLERSFRCKIGEIDIVAEKDDDIYFIEVKARWSDNFGSPLEAVGKSKQKKIINVAKYYIAKKRLHDVNCHLSVVGVDMTSEVFKLEFIEDAFEVS